MIIGKRIRTAFTLNAKGQLTPIGENIFQFKRRRARSQSKYSTAKGKKNHECRNPGSLR